MSSRSFHLCHTCSNSVLPFFTWSMWLLSSFCLYCLPCSPSFASVSLVSRLSYQFFHPAKIWHPSATVFGNGSFLWQVILHLFYKFSIVCFLALYMNRMGWCSSSILSTVFFNWVFVGSVIPFSFSTAFTSSRHRPNLRPSCHIPCA